MTSIVKDEQNTIWVVYSSNKSSGVYRTYRMEKGQEAFELAPFEFPNPGEFAQLFADKTYIWRRSYPFNLSRLHTKSGAIEDFSAKIIAQKSQFPFYNSNLLSLYRDQSGERWLTTRAGIVKMTLEESVFQRYNLKGYCKGKNCSIKAITEDNEGSIYLAHENGIARLDPATGQLNDLPLQLPPQTQTSHGLSYADGYLFWNEYSINLKTYSTQKIIPVADYDFITHGYAPENNTLWLAVNDFPFQIYKYDIDLGRAQKLELSDTILQRLNAEIRQIHHSPTTNTLFLSIWLDGLLELNLSGQVVNEYNQRKNKNGWITNAMYGHYEDEDGQLWIAHGGDTGLSKLDLKTREITDCPYQITPFTGTLKRVFQILPVGNDQLWLITEKGTLLFNKKDSMLSRFPMYPTLSELAFNRLPAFVNAQGDIYVGTTEGEVNAFNPTDLVTQAGLEIPYRVALNSIETYDEKADQKITQWEGLDAIEEIRLSHRDRYINIDFFIPDFRNTEQNLYRYRLEGYDQDWSTPARIQNLRYENLPAGKYRLRIQGGLMPAYYESSERSLKILVRQAWYLSGWAILLYILITLSLFYMFYQYLIRKRLEKADTKRIQDLNALKSRLYTNITHEFRTPLTIIMGVVERIRGHSQEKELILSNSKNVLRLINQLLDLSKLDAGSLKVSLQQGDIIPYLQYLTSSFDS
ncbi:MAG: histidine kinase dimerization/phospho-acceptor domain-containing protein, partial [Bacteroidota bacterium]